MCTRRGFSLAYDAREDFLQARQADFRSPNHALVTNDSAGFSCDRHRTCVHHTARTIAFASDYSLTGRQRFMIATFCKPLGLLFPTWGNTGLDTHTAWQAVHNGDRCIQFQHRPVLVISALYAIFWGFSAFRWYWADSTSILYTDCIWPSTNDF